ncbi:UDP-3-O-acylglucosamine N-acyltransferase [Synergistales bacterium]|nr:UDP-3-O-acylglucosamine N-acyltransferase [Synergistales bacterium]
MPSFSLSEIADIIGGVVVGNGSRVVSGVSSPDECDNNELCVIWDRHVLDKIPIGVAVLAKHGNLRGRDGIEARLPKMALTDILPLFDRRRKYARGIHRSAVISEESVIGDGVSIGPCCVISDGANIGDRVALQANVFIGRDVTIGNDTRIEANVSVQDLSEIGSGVIIHSGTVIACDGFGQMPAGGKWRKIPQIGIVIIEDDVEIGANCTVDRATIGTTRIRRGSKLGSLVHIAHNCDIGEDCVMSGFTATGGSVSIGRGCIVAGMAGISDHVKIGDGVTVGGRAGVTKDIKSGLVVSGFPAREHKEEIRFQASLRRFQNYADRLGRLEKTIRDE